MRLIKLALISIVIFFLLITALSLLIPSHIRISKAVNLHAPPSRILSLIGDTSTWKNWHPAFEPGTRDSIPNISITTQSRTDSEMVVILQQSAKRGILNGFKTYEHQGVDSTTLQWYMDFRMKWYPWQKFGSLFFENTYGVMMEEGLGNIKRITEGAFPDTLTN